jgi:hypothetical protein
VKIDAPTPEFSFVPTSPYEAQWIRSFGVAFCQDNALESVEFDYDTTHQFMKHFRITAEGFMETDMDISTQREIEETRRMHP